MYRLAPRYALILLIYT